MMRNGNTPLHAAIKSFVGDINSIKILLEHDDSDINVRNLEGETPLHLAIKRIKKCSVELIQLLLDHGADVKAATPRDGNTPLHWITIGYMDKGVSFREWCRIAKILVKHGCDVNARNLKGHIPLHLACQKECCIFLSEDGRAEGLVEVLLKYESDANAIDSKGDTPFHLYAQINDQMSSGRVRRFLEKVGDSNISNAKGDTPLHLAVRHEQFDIDVIEAFLDFGPDLSKRNAMGENALEAYCFAALKDDRVVEPSLYIQLQSKEEQLEDSSELHIACLHHRYDEVRELLRRGADVKAVDKFFGYSPLGFVGIRNLFAKVDTCSIVRLMLDHGADMDDICIIEYYASNRRKSLSNIMRLLDEHGKFCWSDVICYQQLAKILAMQKKLVERDTNKELPSLWNRKNWRIPETNDLKREIYDDWFSRSFKELQAMSETKLGESGKTFLDVLLAKAAAPYAKNKELVEAFLAKKAMFPIYEGMLDAQLTRNIYRRKLLDSVIVFLSEVLEFADLSDELYEKTLYYCSNEDLERIVDGL